MDIGIARGGRGSEQMVQRRLPEGGKDDGWMSRGGADGQQWTFKEYCRQNGQTWM